MVTVDTSFLNAFYSEESLKISNVIPKKDNIWLRTKSVTACCTCPKCGCVTSSYHGTYKRKVQDLPILGKNVQLEITAHEYNCTNTECNVTTISETFDDFLNTYSRMTERCADFICTLALETSCEGCARICRTLGIKTSGDTVIRLLLKKYELLLDSEIGDVIGIDDFAYKKRNTYGTIIVNEKTHEPITLLDGRDVETLREWLKNNKQVKIVTRDRVNAYAKVIAEEPHTPDRRWILPRIIQQVEDRFHLYQNLLEAIKKVLNKGVCETFSVNS